MTTDRYYRFLLRFLPASFRRRHGVEMSEAFEEMKRELDTSRSQRGRLNLYLAATVDVGRRAVSTRVRGHRDAVAPVRAGWLRDGFGDVAYAARAMRRTPGFTLVAIVTIALGIGANAAIFTVVNGVILRPLPYPDPEGLFMVFNRYPALDVTRGAQSPGDLWDYRDQTDVAQGYVSVSMYPQTMFLRGEPQLMPVALVTPGFFELLGVEMYLGRGIMDGDDHDRAVLSYGYWQTVFGGDSAVIGQTIPFDRLSKTVVGVLPPDFDLVLPAHLGVPERPQMYTNIPQQGWLGQDGRDRTAHWMNVIGRLRPGATLGQAQAQMETVAAWQRANVPRRAEREAQIDVVSLHAEVVGEVRETLLALAGAVAFVLLIACANVANLLLTKAQHREREMAIRAAIGGSRSRIARQVLTEALVLAGLGAAAGVVLAQIGVDAIVTLQPENVPRLADAAINGTVLAFAAGAAVLAALVFGALPALTASRTDVARALASRGASGGRSSGRARNAFIVIEVSLSLVLLIGSGLLLRSFVALQRVDPGFQTEQMLTFQAQPPQSVLQAHPNRGGPPTPHRGLERYYEDVERLVREIPGIDAAGAVFPTPFSGASSGSTYSTEESADDMNRQLASSQLVTASYFDTVRIPLLAGRTFQPGDAGDKIVVSRALAERVWPGSSAVGKRLQIGWWSGAVWGEVIGVVDDARTHQLSEPNPPTLYRLGSVYAYSPLTIAVRTFGEPTAIIDAVRTRMAELYPTAPLTSIRPLQEYVDEQTAPTRFIMTLILVFAGIAVVLASVGLYGVIAYLVSMRTREIGVRIAFGARTQQVLGLVMRQGLGLTAVGIVIGVVVALGLSRIMSGFLFGVGATDPVTYVALASLLAAVAALACAVPARRAAQVDPVVALNGD